MRSIASPSRSCGRVAVVVTLHVDAWANFKEESISGKLLYVVQYPFTLLRDMTCPLVADDRWNKYWLLLTSFGAPFIIAVFTDGGCGVCL